MKLKYTQGELSPAFATLGVFQPSAGVPPQHSSPAIIACRRPTVSPGQGLKLQHKREGTHLFQQHNAKDGILVRDHLRSIFHDKREHKRQQTQSEPRGRRKWDRAR
ncbi:hypothetical protein AOLI_G00003310 [Acnodon oligacanthus]